MAAKKSKKELKRGLSFSRSNLIVIALLFGVVGGYAIYRSFASGSSLGGVTAANLWITAPGNSPGSCTRSSTPAAYSASTSCGASQFLDQAVSSASPGDTIGVPGGVYTGAYQIINYESRLHNLSPACDPLGTWGSVSTTNCVRFAPQNGQQIYWNFGWENHTSDIWIDGSSTGSVTDRLSRTYSFKFTNVNTEIDSGNAADGTAIDHNTYTGFWSQGMYMGGCQHCRYSQGQVGPRIHVEKAGTAQCPNGVLTVDGTNGTSWPVNPSDATHLPNTGVPTGYSTDGQLPSFEGRNDAHLQNDQVDHMYFYYTTTAADLACDPHDGGMFLRGGIDSFTLADNIWNQNWVYDIQVQDVGDQPDNNGITLENNWFGDPVTNQRSALAGSAGCPTSACSGPNGDVTTAGGAIQVDANTANWTVRYNSFSDSADLKMCYTGTCTMSGWQMYGNTGYMPHNNANGGTACSATSGVTFNYNAWVGGTCGATDTSVSAGTLYNNNTILGQDYSLKGTSGTNPAFNFVSNASFAPPADSINGVARGSAPWDAGSFESSGSSGNTPTASISANPTTIATSGSSTLTWSSTNATSCTASGAWSGAKATSGTQSVSPASTATYTLTCSGTGGTSTPSSATVTVSSTPTATISANPTSINSGGSSTLTWSSANVTSCTASGAWSGSLALSGSQSTGALSSTSTYNISCTGAGGSANASATVTVSTSSGPPTISGFSPTSGPIGTQVTITGTNLDQATVIQFNQGGTVSYTINSPTQIKATVPSGAQTGNFSINFGAATSPQAFTVTTSSSKPGDLNSDGFVTLPDLTILLANWRTTNAVADINTDGIVDTADLSILLSNYGS